MRRRLRKPAPRRSKKLLAAKRSPKRLLQGKRNECQEKYAGGQAQDQVGGQLHQLHRRHAANDSRAGPAALEPGSRAGRFAGNARHDPESSAPRGSGGLSLWPRKSSGKNPTGPPARLRRKRATGLIWKRFARRAVRVSAKYASVAASAPSWAGPPARATRARSRGAAIPAGADLKADRCRCIAVFPSAAFAARLGKRLP